MTDTPDAALLPVDVVYVYRRNPLTGSDCESELFWSLRSVAKHLKGVGRIWIIGDFPLFKRYPGVEYTVIPASDPFQTSQHNVRSKLLKIVHCSEISDLFLLMNDDFFILRDLEARSIPMYRSGTIQQHIDWRECNNPNSPYVGALKDTQRELERAGHPTVDFEVHVPAPLRRSILKEVVGDDEYNWSGQWGLLPRSLYGNFAGFKGSPMMDVKVDSPLTEDELVRRTTSADFLSTGKGGLNQVMFKRLSKLFDIPDSSPHLKEIYGKINSSGTGAH